MFAFCLVLLGLAQIVCSFATDFHTVCTFYDVNSVIKGIVSFEQKKGTNKLIDVGL